MNSRKFIVENDNNDNINVPDEKEFFGISYWGNPYRKGAEWFVVGPYSTSKEARAAVSRRLQKGQPAGFTDWVSGPVKVTSDLNKLKTFIAKKGYRVPASIESGDFFVGDPMMWRLN